MAPHNWNQTQHARTAVWQTSGDPLPQSLFGELAQLRVRQRIPGIPHAKQVLDILKFTDGGLKRKMFLVGALGGNSTYRRVMEIPNLNCIGIILITSHISAKTKKW